jgi:hypothetical protein
MGLWDRLGRLFRALPGPPAQRILDGRSEPLLKASMRMLSGGESGWISMTDAASLFSPARGEYAFGELDDAGKHNIASFATKAGCVVEFMPIEGRIYFTRQPASV